MSVPSAPLVVKRPKTGSTQLEFWWSAPVSGGPITNYTLACTTPSISNSYSGDANYAKVTGLTPLTEYTFTLTATNATGTGPAETFRTVQTGTAPYSGAVASVTVSQDNLSTVIVSWTPSSIASQSATKWYVITPIPSSVASSAFSTKQSAHGYETSRYIKNLSTNIRYQFLIQSVNDVGWARPGLYTSTISMTPIFSPSSIGSMKLWLDAADVGTVTLASGSNISGWRDKSGLSNNALQTNGSVQPTYNSASTFVKFRKANLQQMSLPNNTLPTGNSAFSYFILFGDPAANQGQAMVANDESGRFYHGISGASFTGFFGFSENNLFASNANSYTTYNFSEILYNGTTMYTATNFSTTVSAVYGARNQGGGSNIIGGGSVGHFDGTLAEVLVYSTMLTTPQTQQVEGYLAWKWRIQSSLPRNHPYYEVRP